MPTKRTEIPGEQAAGVFVPAKPAITEEDIQALHEAGERMRTILREDGIDPEDVIREFDELRKKDRSRKIA